MFEIIKAIHEALRSESTAVFVLFVALGAAAIGGSLAWVIDAGYRRTVEERTEETYPIVDFDFRAEGISPDMAAGYIPKLFAKITNRGEFALRDVNLQATEYTLQHHKDIMIMSRIGGSAPLAKQINSRGGESAAIDIRGAIPLLRFDPLPEKTEGPPKSLPVPPRQRFWALRFTFLHGGKKRFVFYKVIEATAPYLLIDESPFGWSWATMNPQQMAPAKAWITMPRKVILADQRGMPWPDNAEEYVPNLHPRQKPQQP